MAIELTYESMAIVAGGLVAAVVVIFVYYKFFYVKVRAEQERLQATHFVAANFIADTRQARFDLYSRKWTRNIMYFLALGATGVVGPKFLGVPSPFDALIMVLSLVISLAAIVVMNIQQTEAERNRNVNAPMGSAHVFYPEQGEVPQSFKRIKIEGEIVLSDAQYDILADQVIASVKRLKSFKDAGLSEDALKQDWLARLKKNKVYRLRVADKYRILLVTQSDFERMKTPDARKMIDETVEVNVQTVPMFLIFAGPTTRIFQSKDDKGRNMFTDRVMGIFIDVFDLAKRDDLLLTGNFTAMTKTDALLAEFLHLYEQHSATATEMTKTLRDLDKSKAEIEEEKFNDQAEANRLMASAENLLKIVASLVSPESTTKKEYILYLILVAFGLLLGKVIP